MTAGEIDPTLILAIELILLASMRKVDSRLLNMH